MDTRKQDGDEKLNFLVTHSPCMVYFLYSAAVGRDSVNRAKVWVSHREAEASAVSHDLEFLFILLFCISHFILY
jgi:hypothetical protein